jgi:hypothetical protein
MRRLTDLNADGSYWLWWLRREAWAILGLGGLAAVGLAIFFYARHEVVKPVERSEGVVVRFGGTAQYKRRDYLVTVRTADGRTHHLHADRSRLIACTPGSTIRLMRRGSVLEVDRAGCPGPSPS